MIIKKRLPTRITIGPDTRLLILTISSIQAFKSYQHTGVLLKLRKGKEKWVMTPVIVENSMIYFDVSDTSCMNKHGLYRAELFSGECLLDTMELIKGASYTLSAEARDDACAEGTWDEVCCKPPVKPLERCKTTGMHHCGCDCDSLPGGKCPACLDVVVVSVLNNLEGY